MGTNNLPFTSIIVPVYNSEKTIGKCIESLLSQGYPKNKYEIIVVDNNSKDRTAETIKKYPVKYIMEDKVQSSYAARNTGAKIAKGEAFVFFDADQIADKNWLKNLLREWQQLKYGGFGGKNVAVATTDSIAGKIWKKDETTKLEKQTFDSSNRTFLKLAGGNAAFRKDVFKMLGGFDSGLFSMGDFDLALRLQKELNLSIKYTDNAIIYHLERPCLKSLLKREFRMGYGSYLFGCKHPEYKLNLFVESVKGVKRTILGFGALLFNLFKAMSKIEKRERIYLILIDIAMKWSNIFGKIQAFLTRGIRIFPANW